MADVTKDLLLKISTTGDDGAIDIIEKITNKTIGLNQAWELFNKILGLAKSAVGFLADTFAGMVDISSNFEQMGIRFETIFGGSGPAQKALDWAVKFAATTPLSLEQVTEAMMRLKAYGFDPMSGSLQSIGDAAFALGGDFNSIVLALGQMSLRGHVVQQELNQLTNNNIPAAKWLQEEFRLTAEQMGDIGKQAISSDKAIKVIMENFDKFYGGSLTRAGDTWKGALTTIWDTWVIFQKTIMDSGPFEFLVDNIKKIRDAFSSWADSKSGLAVAGAIGKTLLDNMVNFKDVILNSISPTITGLGETLIDFAKSFALIWNPIVNIAGAVLIPLGMGISAIAKGLGLVSEPINSIEGVFSALVTELLPGAIMFIGKIYDGVQQLWFFMRSIPEHFVILFEKGLALLTYGLKVYVAELAKILPGGIIPDSMLDKLGELSNSLRADAEARTNALGAITAKEYETLRLSGEFWSDFANNTKKDLGKMQNVIDAFKIDVKNPFGLQSALNAFTSGSTSSSTQKGTVLYDVETGRGAEKYFDPNVSPPQVKIDKETSKNLISPELPKKNEVQLIAPPGDDLLTVFVKYVNKSIRAEGTIGAGF